MTTQIYGDLQLLTGEPADGYIVRATLLRTDWNGAITVQSTTEIAADSTGRFELDLVANEGMTQGSSYLIEALRPPAMRRVWHAQAVVPDQPSVELTQIIHAPPYPPISDAQQAVIQAQAAASAASSYADQAELDAQAADQAAQSASGDKDLAEAAQQAADTARQAAEQAEEAAGLAQQASESAAGDSESARDLAQTAQQAAETAQGLAEAAQQASETAQGLAETAQQAAESAQSQAEGYRDEAESYRDDAQTAASKIPEPTGTDNSSIIVRDGAFVVVKQPPGFLDVPPGRPYVWDDFQRDPPPPSGATDVPLGTSTSGHEWVGLAGFDRHFVGARSDRGWTGLAAANTSAVHHVDVIDLGLDAQPNWTLNCRGIVQPSGATNSAQVGHIIAKDENNWVRLSMGSVDLILEECIDGVITQIGITGASAAVGLEHRGNPIRMKLDMHASHYLGQVDTGGTSAMGLNLRVSASLNVYECRYVGIYTYHRFWGHANFLGYRGMGWR